MRIQVVGSALGKGDQRHFLQTLLVDEQIAIDAGCLGLLSPVDIQRRVQHVFLSHSHLDHIASLPFFLDNVYEHRPHCPTVYGSEAVWQSLWRDVFNDRVWPDLRRMSQEETPFLRPVVLTPGISVQVADLTVTPVLLQHVVPTMGFVLRDANATVGLVSDTLPTDEVWQLLRAAPSLRAVFLEVSFPNELQWLADKAGHLTPQTFRQELQKLGRDDVDIVAIHLKPTLHDRIAAELQSLGWPRLEIARPDKIYEYG